MRLIKLSRAIESYVFVDNEALCRGARTTKCSRNNCSSYHTCLWSLSFDSLATGWNRSSEEENNIIFTRTPVPGYFRNVVTNLKLVNDKSQQSAVL